MNFWLTDRINDRVKKLRFESMGLDPVQVQQATQPVALRNLGLVQVKSDGTVQAAEEKDSMAGVLLPLFVMMLMFMVIFMASQPMLESVLEEKSLRIAEVLLGSVNPWQLMWGKLLGCVAGSLTIVAFYVVGAYIFAVQKGYSDMIPLHLIPWFIVFQILGVMFYASIFLAVGASVSQLKEAQSMLLPAWILLMSPMFVWFLLYRSLTDLWQLAFRFSHLQHPPRWSCGWLRDQPFQHGNYCWCRLACCGHGWLRMAGRSHLPSRYLVARQDTQADRACALGLYRLALNVLGCAASNLSCRGSIAALELGH